MVTTTESQFPTSHPNVEVHHEAANQLIVKLQPRPKISSEVFKIPAVTNMCETCAFRKRRGKRASRNAAPANAYAFMRARSSCVGTRRARATASEAESVAAAAAACRAGE